MFEYNRKSRGMRSITKNINNVKRLKRLCVNANTNTKLKGLQEGSNSSTRKINIKKKDSVFLHRKATTTKRTKQYE